jgi:hypothetical protein
MSRVQLTVLTLLIASFAACSKAQKETPSAQPAQEQQTAPPQATPPEAQPAQQAESAPAQKEPDRAPAKRRSDAEPAKSAARPQSAPEAPVTRTEPAPSPTAKTPPTPAAPPTRSEAIPATPPTPPKPTSAVIPSGRTVEVRLQDPLDTGVNEQGDSFKTALDRDLVIDGQVVAPRGSILQGKVTQVARSGRVEGLAAMALELTQLRIGDQSYPIQTNLLKFEADSTKKSDAAKVGVGAGIGAVIGAIAGGGKGAAIGAAVGGGAGGATVLATRGKELKFDPEHRFTFTLQHDVEVKLR